MLHLILTACLAASSPTCGPIILPQGQAESLDLCREGAGRISAAWLAVHPDLTGAGSACVETADLPELSLTEIAPGVHVHFGNPVQLEQSSDGRIANLGVVIGQRSVAVIDAGVSRAQGQALYGAIRRLTDLPVSHVILTHMHPDHALGASVFQEAGAEIVGHAALPLALELRADVYLNNIRRLLPVSEALGTTVALPDRTVETVTEIDLGGRVLRLQATRTAHTDNDLWVMDQQTGTMFSGDLIFRDLTPVLDGSLTGWLQWLGTAPAPVPQRIVPGHGPAADGWQEAIVAQEQFLKALEAETRARLAQGMPMSEAVPSVVKSMEFMDKAWHGFSDTLARDATAAYKELEWE